MYIFSSRKKTPLAPVYISWILSLHVLLFKDLISGFICYSEKISFLTGLKLRGGSFQKGQLQCLGNLFWCSSLASFMLLTKSLPHSVASVLFFSVCYFFRPVCQHLCYRTCGVTRCQTVGALVLCLLPFLFRIFLTKYWEISSSLEDLKSLQILLTHWASSNKA